MAIPDFATLSAMLRSGQYAAPPPPPGMGAPFPELMAIPPLPGGAAPPGLGTLLRTLPAGPAADGIATLSGREGAPPPEMMALPPPPPRPGQAERTLMPPAGLAGQAERDQLAQDARSFGVATEMVGAAPAWRAGQAVAAGDPLGAVGNAALAMMPYRPALGLRTLGAGYGGALAADLGMLGPSGANAQNRGPQRETLPGLSAAQQAEYDRAQQRLRSGNFSSGAERRATEETVRELRRLSQETMLLREKASLDAQARTSQADRTEYDRTVQRAEAARDAELARDRRFSDTHVGRLYDLTGGHAPMAWGALTGALTRTPLSAIGWGGLAGAGSANVPLGYNAAFTEPDNPQRRGYEAYGRELPLTHPRRQEWLDYARGLPEENPVRREAIRQLSDPGQTVGRTLFGAAEGALGGHLGHLLVRTPSTIAGWLTGNRSTPTPPPSAPPGPSSPSPIAPPSGSPPPPPVTTLADMLRGRGQATLPEPTPPPQPTGLPRGFQEDTRLPSGVRGPGGRIAADPRRRRPPEETGSD